MNKVTLINICQRHQQAPTTIFLTLSVTVQTTTALLRPTPAIQIQSVIFKTLQRFCTLLALTSKRYGTLVDSKLSFQKATCYECVEK
eukprot:m.57323 g.57323  ORF g.57323 m.57323 type:complete len:87 (-) comp22368_c0_seq1:96-356(-)